MSARIECPSMEQLRELAVGRLPDPPAGALEEHLLVCDECAQKTAQLQQEDTLVSAMRGARSVVGGRSPEERARLDQLLSSLSGLRSGVVDRTSLSHLDETHISGADAADDAEADLTQFLPALWPAEAADELGRLGGFRLLKLLGHGGMGAVFLAEDVRLKRRVALKVLRPEFAKKKDAAERFLREAQAAAAVRHDNVVGLLPEN